MEKIKGKFVTPEEAVLAVRDGDWVDYGFGAGFPELLDRALAARRGRVKDVKVRGGLVIRPRIEIVESDPEQESFTYYSWHIGDYERKLQSRGLVRFLPVALRYLPYLYRDGHIRCRGPTKTATAALAFQTLRGGRSLRAPVRSSLRSTSAIRACRAWTAHTACI